MRLLCTIPYDDPQIHAEHLSSRLKRQGIANQLDLTDAGQEIWIISEHKMEKAQELLDAYSKEPPKKFAASPPKRQPPKRRGFLSLAPYGRVSIAIIFCAIALFVFSMMQKGAQMPQEIPGVVQAPILPPIERALIYDYPSYFKLRDQMIKNKDPAQLPKLRSMSVWMGIYDRVVAKLKNGEDSFSDTGPMFGDIARGQVWRIFTPALLHFNLLHILFNLLWFIMLGNQVEYRIGSGRYLFLILLSAAVSNTAQYLMSGPFFMGLSGVVCALAAFIWARQQVAPWEGYLLQRFTIIFLLIYVFGMFALQTVFFFLQIFSNFQLTIGIANTAHITGGIVGYLCGRTRMFRTK